MAKNNGDYWKERFGILNENLLNKGEKFNAEMAKAYDTAANNIQKEIEGFYGRFADNNKISLAEARRILDSKERKAFQMELKEYIKKGKENALNQKWVKELENASDVYRIDRLKALQMQMRQQVEVLETVKNKGLKRTLGNIYEEGYYKTAYEIQRGLGTGVPFSTLDTNRIEKVLAKPWTPDGKNFSEKIWGEDRTKLVNQLDTKLTQSIIRGESPDKVIREITKTMDVSRNAASRLVMTESAFFASAAQRDSYKELEIEQYQILSTLDSVTCGVCGVLDEKPIPMKEYAEGVTAPPFHPNCRCTTVPYFDDEFTQGEMRAARDTDGKTEQIDNISYKDWKKKYANNAKNDIIKKRFIPAQSIKEAEEYARKELGIQHVSYKGCDLATANAWNEGLKDTFNRFPEIKNNFGFVGECHERNKLLKSTAYDYYLKKYLAAYPDYPKDVLKPYAEKDAAKFMKRMAVSKDTMAQSWSPLTEEFKIYRGITVNRDYGKNFEQFIKTLDNDMSSNWHPAGCNTVRSVLDHEIGHQLDSMLNISEHEKIEKLFNGMSQKEMTVGLSEYAWNNNNKNKFGEFIAEGWAEYCNNPNPRPVAKEIGKTIEGVYDEWKKKNL